MATRPLRYFTLITIEDGRWVPQFGDWSLAVVKQEQRDSYKGQTWHIVYSDGTQAGIDAAVAAMNKPVFARVEDEDDGEPDDPRVREALGLPNVPDDTPSLDTSFHDGERAC